MILSMTGFGKATGAYGSKKINVEVRSLNSKQLDLNLRMPSKYKEKEMELKSRIAAVVERGKVDVAVYYEDMGEEKLHSINHQLAAAYYADLKQLCSELELPEGEILGHILRLPDVVTTEKKEVDENEWKTILSIADEALKNFKSFRLAEGSKLQEELNKRVAIILEQLVLVEPFEKERMETVKTKLRKTLEENVNPEIVDKNRFEQELIYYLERLDVSEEKMRLHTHCTYFTETMNADDQSGRKLGFIAQEMGREINTLGSKSNHASMQKIVVLMKDELEKIKEQVLNVL